MLRHERNATTNGRDVATPQVSIREFPIFMNDIVMKINAFVHKGGYFGMFDYSIPQNK